MKKITLIIFVYVLSGCAALHHIQLSDVDSLAVQKGKKIEILVSETGINIDEASQVAKVFMAEGDRGGADNFAETIKYFQMGPRTGNIVLNENYTDGIKKALLEKCPTGNLSNLVSIRETRKYPVVSGEIVKITGYCL